MSVLIRGMKMPECCDVCQFSGWSNLHQTALCRVYDYKPCFKDFSQEYESKRSNNCPLVELPEKHGDLIDRDALVPDIFHDWNGYTIPDDDYSQKCIRNAPVIIEAECECGK